MVVGDDGVEEVGEACEGGGSGWAGEVAVVGCFARGWVAEGGLELFGWWYGDGVGVFEVEDGWLRAGCCRCGGHALRWWWLSGMRACWSRSSREMDGTCPVARDFSLRYQHITCRFL